MKPISTGVVNVAKKHVLTKEEIRKPDEISLFFMNLWEGVKKYRKPLILTTCTGVVIAAAIFGYIHFQGARDARTTRALWAGFQNWMRPLAAETDEPEVLAGQRQPVKDQKELLSGTHEIYTKGIAGCGSSNACALLHLVRGRVSLELALLGENRETHLQEAQKDLQKARKVEGFLKTVVYDSLGLVYEELGKYDEALETYRNLATMVKGVPSGQAMIHQARVMELQGKKDEAVAMYNEVVKSKSTGQLASQEARLQQMIGLYQMMASMPQNQMGDEGQRMQIFQALNQARLQLIRLQESASVADPGQYAKVRLAFLDLNLDMHSSAPKMEPAVPVNLPVMPPPQLPEVADPAPADDTAEPAGDSQ